MAVVETPVAVAAWPSLMAAAIVAAADPTQIVQIVEVAASVAVGMMTRRTISSARGIASIPLTADLKFIFLQTLIALVTVRGLGLSGIAMLGMAAVVGGGGIGMIEGWFRQGSGRVPGSQVLPPYDPAPAIYDALAKVEDADARGRKP